MSPHARPRPVTVVIDAGVVVALIVAEGRQDAARAHVENWLDVDAALHAPTVLPCEIANVLTDWRIGPQLRRSRAARATRVLR